MSHQFSGIVARLPNIGPYIDFKGDTDLPMARETSSLRCAVGIVKCADGVGFGVQVDPDFVKRAQPVKL